MEDESEDREQRLHDARMARKDAETAELAKLKGDNADLLAALDRVGNLASCAPHDDAEKVNDELGKIMWIARQAARKARTP